MSASRLALVLASGMRTASAAAPSRAMATGVVKWFNVSKGFGFITPDDKTKQDVFVHHSGIQSTGFRSLVEGETVKYDVQNSDRGVQAVNVTKPDGTPITREGESRGPRAPRREGGAPSGGKRRAPSGERRAPREGAAAGGAGEAAPLK